MYIYLYILIYCVIYIICYIYIIQDTLSIASLIDSYDC